MKQYLFANCYSTIHGLNLIKYINNTYTHTFRVLQLEESLKLVTSTRGRSQAETLLSLLHTDQFISSVRLWRIVWLLALSWAGRRSYRFRVFPSDGWGNPGGWLARCVMSLREPLLRLAVAWFLCDTMTLEVLLFLPRSFRLSRFLQEFYLVLVVFFMFMLCYGFRLNIRNYIYIYIVSWVYCFYGSSS